MSKRVLGHPIASFATLLGGAADFVIQLAVLMALLSRAVQAQDRQPAEVLSNRSVIEMVAGKLPREVIVDKIKRTATQFDVSARGLLSLHIASVPREIMTVMLDRMVRDRPLVDTLDNTAVTEMVNGKLPKDVLLSKLRQTPAAFDISTSGLVALNSAKVPKDIITLMMHFPRGPEELHPVAQPVAVSLPESEPMAAEGTTPASKDYAPPTAARPSSPKPGDKVVAPAPARVAKALLSPLPAEPGIHMVSDDDMVTLLEPNAFTSGRTSNVLASAITSGLAPVKMKAVVSAGRAAIRVDDPSAEFYFVFERTSGGLSTSNHGWASVSSPNEFTLIRLDPKADRREATTGSFSALGSSTGTESKSVVPTTFKRLKPGVYRVVPNVPLVPGEYAFFPASAYGPAGGTSRLFDFGVDAPAGGGVTR